MIIRVTLLINNMYNIIGKRYGRYQFIFRRGMTVGEVSPHTSSLLVFLFTILYKKSGVISFILFIFCNTDNNIVYFSGSQFCFLTV